jgi:tRNA A-37 threonylcarbamoyl transferase component Bud32
MFSNPFSRRGSGGGPPAEGPGREPGVLRVDEAVDRYVVEACIGEGAMARVYRVRHRLLGTVHALKVLRSTQPELRERLVQEGRIQAGLAHPNVVPVTDVLDVGGRLGLLMDHVAGGSLEAWLAEGLPPRDAALAVFSGVLAGVGAAHAMGIVHRDLKPANVLLDREPLQPRVTDFGLARHLRRDDGRQTRAGELLGSPAYMAPEQAAGAADVTARADIFALGALLYELVCGQRAFQGRTVYELLGRLGRGEYTPPLALAPDLPASVVAAIASCLAVDPEDRPPSCAAVQALLSGQAPRPAGPLSVADGVPLLQLRLTAAGELEVQRLQQGERPAGPARCVAGVDRAQLVDLTARARRDSAGSTEWAALGRAVAAAAGLSEVSGATRPVRLSTAEPALTAVPWECMGGEWVRAVASTRPVVPRELRGALRVLELVDDAAGESGLRGALAEPVAAGRLEWLPPARLPELGLAGLAARFEVPPRPHVLLIRAALSLDAQGQPGFALGTGGGGARVSLWDLAALLDRRRCPDLRVVVAEPRYRSAPGSILSDLLDLPGDAATTGVFWPWPVDEGDLQRACCALLAELADSGDVVEARAAARAAASGPARSVLLAMRGTDPVVFDLSRRRLRPVPIVAEDHPLTPEQAQLHRHLQHVLPRPAGASVFLGDAPLGGRPGGAVRALCAELQGRLEAVEHGSLAQAMQRVEMLEDREELRALVQDALEEAPAESGPQVRVLDGLARMCGPGLCVSLTLLPVFADALALHHPDREVVVLQPLRPGELERLRVFRRPAGGRRWERGGREAVGRLDLARQHVVLRLHGGVPAPGRGVLGDPVLTETDQLELLAALDTIPARLLAHFRRNPVVFLGFSPERWAHRAVVRGLTGGQTLSEDSLAVMLPEADALHERYWSWERGPAGARGVRQVKAAVLEALVPVLAPAR